MGDPDTVNMPVAGLISKEYAAALRASIGEQRDARRRHPRRPARRFRGPQHHAFLRHRPRRQRGLEHLHAQFLLRRRPGRRRHRRPAQQRARRFHRQAGRRQRLWPARLQRQSAGAGQAPAVVDDADHRAQGRQAGAGHRLARRQPHHHRGAAGDRNVIDFHMTDRRGGRRAAPASPMAAGPGLSSSRVSRLRCSMRSPRRGHRIVPTEPHTAANSIAVIPKTEFTPQT